MAATAAATAESVRAAARSRTVGAERAIRVFSAGAAIVAFAVRQPTPALRAASAHRQPGGFGEGAGGGGSSGGGPTSQNGILTGTLGAAARDDATDSDGSRHSQTSGGRRNKHLGHVQRSHIQHGRPLARSLRLLLSLTSGSSSPSSPNSSGRCSFKPSRTGRQARGTTARCRTRSNDLNQDDVAPIARREQDMMRTLSLLMRSAPPSYAQALLAPRPPSNIPP